MPQHSTRQSQAKQRPEKTIGPLAGGVGVSIWLNTAQTDNGPRQFRSITIKPRRYYDREAKEWKDAPSYNPGDLPALIYALTKAQEYVFETPLPGQGGEGDEGASAEDVPY